MKYNNTVPDDSNTNGTDGRIPLGKSGKGDTVHLWPPSVIKDGATYKMWYGGQSADNGRRIYYATSTNGLDWQKHNNSIPSDSNGSSTEGRIPQGSSSDRGDYLYASRPCVIKDGATYKMWYGAAKSGNRDAYYATSPNGLDWTKQNNVMPTASDTNSTDGRLPRGTGGQGDDAAILDVCVIKDGATYKMWYAGQDSASNYYRIYHATSTNGLIWTKYNNDIPANSDGISTNGGIPLGTDGKGDNAGVRGPTVLKEVKGSIYKMWYEGYDGTNYRIYHATSSNGLTWTKYDNSIPDDSDTNSSNGRIPLGESGGDIIGVGSPCVIKDGYFYKMWYRGTDGSAWRIYYATCDQLPKGLIFYSH